MRSLTDLMRRLILTPLSGRSWWIAVGLGSVAAFLLAAFVSSSLFAAKMVPDYVAGYHPGALGIQTGVGYVDNSGEFITRWPPGWSTFISPWVVEDARESVDRLRYVSGFLAAAWVLLLAFLMRILLPNISIVVPLGMAAFWPPMWAMGNPMVSEMLFATLSTIGLILLVHLSRTPPESVARSVTLTAAAWLVLSAAALTKTIGLAVAGGVLLAIIVGFHPWSMKRRIAVVLSGLLVFSLGLSPWVLYYKRQTGHCGFTSNALISVEHGLVRYPDFPLGQELKERSESWGSFEEITADLLEVSAADPLGALHLAGLKIVHPWYATWTGRFDKYLLIFQLPWLVLFVLASGRTVIRWKRTPGEIILIHAYVGAVWMTATFVAPIVRYLAPALPFVVAVVWWHLVDAGFLHRGPTPPQNQTEQYPVS